MSAGIWFTRPTLTQLNHAAPNLNSLLGIEFTTIGDDFLCARMPVDERTRQPMGLLHGGASVALAETLGSTGAWLCIDPAQRAIVGLEINANHIRSVREGFVTGTAKPLHRGQTTQLWEIHITDAAERLVCVSRLTIAVLDQAGAKPPAT